MQIVYEEGDADYEAYQALVMAEIVRNVRQRLAAAGVKGRRLRELVTDIAFDVGAIVDGTQMITTDDGHLAPILGFAEGRVRGELLLSHGGGASSLHEFVPGVVDNEFEVAGC